MINIFQQIWPMYVNVGIYIYNIIYNYIYMCIYDVYSNILYTTNWLWFGTMEF